MKRLNFQVAIPTVEHLTNALTELAPMPVLSGVVCQPPRCCTM